MIKRVDFNLINEKKIECIDAETLYIAQEVRFIGNAKIYPNVIIEGESEIGKDVVIESGTVIKNSKIQNGVQIYANSYIEDSIVGENSKIGPFARLRPGTEIGKNVKIGNFVEVKKSKIMEGVKISHLSYVGDAEIGKNTNVGCGFITCNYDGKLKHKTTIGENVFIGSDCQAIAPISIESDSMIAAGTTITANVKKGDLAISRTRQINKAQMAQKFLKK